MKMDILYPDLFYVSGEISNSIYNYFIQEIIANTSNLNASYTINREYFETIPIRDIHITPLYTFILGGDIHKIVYNKISRKFVPDNKLISQSLIIEGLTKVQLVKNTHYEKN